MLTAVNYGSTSYTNTAWYYFLHNSRGDITGVYNSSGVLRARYNYDSWGNVTVTDASGNVITDENHIGNLNKIRYRGYYQDTETGLYYLMSRYYDPQTHRFVNADGYFATGQGILDTNMNIYCGNNPVNYCDETGTRCHANDNGRKGPLCFVNFITGYCNTCHKQECCMYSPGTVKSKNNVSYNVYIITPQKNYNSWNYTWYYKEDITNVYIMDYRNNKDPNMQILNSYIIDTKELKLEIIGLMQEYNNKVPSEREWKRSNDSMLVEWDFHNFAYNLGYKKDRTGDTDFNNNDEGKGFKDFVFR